MKIGIVGCGEIASAHLSAITRAIPQPEIFLCDINQKNAERLAQNEFVFKTYTDLDEMITKEKLDVMHILTPPPTHYTLAKKALQAGCHVLLEKPATERADQLKQLYKIAKEKNKVLCIDHSFLGMPVILRVKSKIKSGCLGKLITVHCHFGASGAANEIPYADPYHWSYNIFGGVLANWAPHPASVIIDLMDPIKEYKFQFLRRNILPNNCPDLLHVMVKNADQIGSFTLSMGHGNNERHIDILFENGTIFIDITRQLYTCISWSGPQNFVKKALSGIKFGLSPIKGTIENVLNVVRGKLSRDPGIMNITNNFYNSINSGDELLVSKENAEVVTELLENIWESFNNSKI